MKKIIYIYIFTTLLFLSCGHYAFAKDVQQATIEKSDISFEAAYALMLTNNNDIKAALEEVNAKKFEKRAAVGQFFPKIGMGANYTHFNDDIMVDLPMGLSPLTLQDKNLFTFGFGATWNVFTGGKIYALNKAARAKYEGSNLKYKTLSNQLTVELVKRYYGLRLTQDVVALKRQVMEGSKRHLDDAKALEKEGLIPRSERLHAEVAYRQAQKNYNSSLKDEAIIEESLKNLIKADDVDLSNVKIHLASSMFIYNKELDSLQKLKENALKNNPNYRQTEVQKKLSQANYISKAAEYSPVLSVYTYDIAASGNLSHQVPRFGVGVSANMLLFDGLSRYNNLRAADAYRKQVKYTTMGAKNSIETLVTKNYNELLKYKEEYKATDKMIESTQEALRTATLGFKEGMTTSLSVIDAQNALEGAKLQRLNALYNYDIAFVELLSSQGSAEEILNYIKDSTEEGM